MRHLYDIEMNFFLIALSAVLVTNAAYRLSPEPPDERGWDEVYKSFSSKSFDGGNDGERDGTRLLELDKEKAKKLLLDYLDKSHPTEIRLKAVNAVGWNKIEEGIDPLIEIVEDPKESKRLRYNALNPGLTYMNNPRAEAFALSLVAENNRELLRSYIWVLSKHDSEASLNALTECISMIEEEFVYEVINALNHTNNPAVSQIVYENVQIHEREVEPKLLRSYARAMQLNPIPDARQTMKELAAYDDTLVQLYSLRFFKSYPTDDISTKLILYLEYNKGLKYELKETVSAFIESDSISESNRTKLQVLQKKLYPSSENNRQMEALFGVKDPEIDTQSE